MDWPIEIGTRSLKVHGRWHSVRIDRWDTVQGLPARNGGTYYVLPAQYFLDGEMNVALIVAVDSLVVKYLGSRKDELLNWLPKAGLVKLIHALVIKAELPRTEPIAVEPDEQLSDPQKHDMRFFRNRCRYDVIRVINECLMSSDSSLSFSLEELRASSLLTRLYDDNDLVSGMMYWARKGLLQGLSFDNTCRIDDLRDEEISKIVVSYDWEESSRPETGQPTNSKPRADIFICHASEDKDAFVRTLAEALTQEGLSVWYDEYALKLGDSLRRSIDQGLAACRYGVVILSANFFAKKWPQYELDGLAQKEMADDSKVILPIWHGVNRKEVEKYSLPLAGRFAISTERSLDEIVNSIFEVVRTHG